MADRIKVVSVTKMMYGWTKYGGSNHGLVKKGGEWYCQSCGKEQPDEFPAYMMCVDGGNYRSFIRLCAHCENVVKKNNIKCLLKLKEKLKVENEWDKYKTLFKN